MSGSCSVDAFFIAVRRDSSRGKMSHSTRHTPSNRLLLEYHCNFLPRAPRTHEDAFDAELFSVQDEMCMHAHDRPCVRVQGTGASALPPFFRRSPLKTTKPPRQKSQGRTTSRAPCVEPHSPPPPTPPSSQVRSRALSSRSLRLPRSPSFCLSSSPLPDWCLP